MGAVLLQSPLTMNSVTTLLMPWKLVLHGCGLARFCFKKHTLLHRESGWIPWVTSSVWRQSSWLERMRLEPMVARLTPACV
jgi:hypothetical protein